MRRHKTGGDFLAGTINWTGNRVLDPATTNQAAKPTNTLTPTPASIPQTFPIQQNTALTQEGMPPATERGYIPYYLASNIGKSVRAEFIIGTTQYVDKTGVISEVGINYFVLRDVNSRTDIMCDLYSVKFVTVLNP